MYYFTIVKFHVSILFFFFFALARLMYYTEMKFLADFILFLHIFIRNDCTSTTDALTTENRKSF